MRNFQRSLLAGACLGLVGGLAYGQPQSGAAANGSPGWFLFTPQAPPQRAIPIEDQVGGGGRASAPLVPACIRSTICDPRTGGSRDRNAVVTVQWRQTLGYTASYPVKLAVPGGVPGIAHDSKGNLWVFERSRAGQPQLFKFDPNYKLVLTVGPDVLGRQEKAHGIAVDSHDNVWIADATSATIMQVSPEGKVLKTLGTRGKRGDWDEAKGQRLLWEPLHMAFAPNGDMYIAEGHGNESPNDADSDDPANQSGASRIIHLDKDGRFINQWYGNSVGPGKFSMAHGIAIDPKSGDIWIGDREQFRLVVYTKDGKFLKTVQLRNLACAPAFDPQGNLWVSSGHDGQILKIDRDGKVLGAMGNGPGNGPGQAVETNYLTWDSKGNLYTGDTGGGRVTMWSPPAKAK